jgi:ankyrin repeat protein
MNRIDEELVEAAQKNNLPEVRRLLSIGANIEVKDYDGWTPLIDASVSGRVQLVVELLKHGAHTEAENSDGWTALHLACSKGHLAVVTELVSGGANILVANHNGSLPIHCAVSYGKSAVSKYLLQQLYAKTRRLPLHELLEDLAWIGDLNSIDAPPLRYALHRNVLGADHVVEILKYLVDGNPALLSSLNQDGSLPLHLACRRGASFTVVQSLVNLYKASVKSVTLQGDLPLFLACEMPDTSLDTIFLLIKLYPDLVYR